MPERQLTGSRIRERRILRGLRQADLAQRADISASYLNLIEHNRRRIGGKLLLRLAEVLEVEPSLLSEGAEAAVVATLGEARAADPNSSTGEDSAQEFASRFPGWADLLVRRHRRVLDLERKVEALSDRLTHDPHLASALHEVLSTVTAIRSTAGILSDTPQLEPEWRDRFHRNINEDAARLTDSAQSLVSYLDEEAEDQQGFFSPQEELETFLSSHNYHFDRLEAGDALPSGSLDLPTVAGRELAESYLEQYKSDSTAVPMQLLQEYVDAHGVDPARIAQKFGVTIGRAMRRLAAMPQLDGARKIGMVSCDASGTILFRKPIEGFSVPRFGAACPKWPLFHALTRPMMPLHDFVEQDGRNGQVFETFAIAEPASQAQFGSDPMFQAHMLIVSQEGVHKSSKPVAGLGVGCRICPRTGCEGRREPSILSDGF